MAAGTTAVLGGLAAGRPHRPPPAAWSTTSANEWTGGFTAAIRVTAGDTPVNGWTVTWTYGGDQRITNGWNAKVTQSGAAVTARNVAWNGCVAGRRLHRVRRAGHVLAPARPRRPAFTLNGEPCNGADTDHAAQPPTPPTTGRPPTDHPAGDPPTAHPAAHAPRRPRRRRAGCAGAVLCDGFENQTGTAPAGDWSVQPTRTAPGTGTASDRHARSRTRAAGRCGSTAPPATATTSSSGPTATSAGLGAVRYGRFWVRHTTALPTAHVTFLAMRDTNDGNRDLRMGGQNGALQWNRASDDATLPEQSPAGVALSLPLPANRWTCVEFMVDGAQGQLQTWVDGTAVTGPDRRRRPPPTTSTASGTTGPTGGRT